MRHALLLTWLATGALGDGVPVGTTVALRAEAAVDTTDIRLPQVADIAAPPELAARLAQVSLGSAPVPGQARTIAAGYVRLRLKRHDIDPSALTLTGEGVTVRRARQLPPPSAGGATSPERGAAAGPEPCVRRGQTVTVQVRRGAVVVTLEGRVCQDAAAGQAVRVQMPRTNRALDAVVVGPGQLVVRP